MTVIKSFVLVLLAAALVVAAFEIVLFIETGKYKLTALGQLWYEADRSSLNTAQVVIQRYLFSWLWDPVIIFILTLPAWPVFGMISLIVLYSYRRREKRRKFLY